MRHRTQDEWNLILEVIMATIFGAFGGFVVWALVPNASWWLVAGMGVFWFLVSFFSANSGSRR